MRDPGTADDLVQDTWVAAIGSERRGPARPWLGRILRNTLLQRARSDRRREHRERRAADPEALPSSDQLVETLERQRLLAAAVLELDDGSRSWWLRRCGGCRLLPHSFLDCIFDLTDRPALGGYAFGDVHRIWHILQSQQGLLFKPGQLPLIHRLVIL